MFTEINLIQTQVRQAVSQSSGLPVPILPNICEVWDPSHTSREEERAIKEQVKDTLQVVADSLQSPQGFGIGERDLFVTQLRHIISCRKRKIVSKRRLVCATHNSTIREELD